MAAQTGYIEKRVYIRVDCDIPMRYAFVETDNAKAPNTFDFKGKVQNVSEGGLLLLCQLTSQKQLENLINKKSFIAGDIELDIAGSSPKFVGEVRWHKIINREQNIFELGIQFTNIAKYDFKRINAFIFREFARQNPTKKQQQKYIKGPRWLSHRSRRKINTYFTVTLVAILFGLSLCIITNQVPIYTSSARKTFNRFVDSRISRAKREMKDEIQQMQEEVINENQDSADKLLNNFMQK